jgi:AraC-like DNA-binding protein
MLSGREAQIWRHQPAYWRPRHFHEEPEINLVLAGEARIGVGDRIVELCAGELVLFEPGQDHALIEASPDLELFVLALRPRLAERIRGASPTVFKDKIVHAERALPDVRERVAAVGEMRDGSAVEREVGDLFFALGSLRSTCRVSSRRALGQLRASPEVSAAELAHLLGVAPAQVSREFHRELGLTLVEYRARVRLMRFIALVDAGASFSSAAMDADFGSYTQCHRVFHRVLGCSPRDYFSGARSLVDAATQPVPDR